MDVRHIPRGLFRNYFDNVTLSHSKATPRLLARDRQIPALRGKIGTRNGDLAIPFEQKQTICVKCDIVKLLTLSLRGTE